MSPPLDAIIYPSDTSDSDTLESNLSGVLDPLDPVNSTNLADDNSFRLGFMLDLALFFVAFRFLYEMKRCFRECWTYTKLKVTERRRLLTMTLTTDSLTDMLISECSVCLEEFAVGDKVMILPCYHNFHEKCIREWLPQHQNCPLCRAEILE